MNERPRESAAAEDLQDFGNSLVFAEMAVVLLTVLTAGSNNSQFLQNANGSEETTNCDLV